MSEEKQLNPEGPRPQVEGGANRASKKINRDVLKWIIVGIIGFTIVILIFSAGMFVGGMKARFSYRWAESYHKNFAGPRGGFFGDWRMPFPPPGDFIEGHGTFGEIIQISDTDLVVKGRGDVEKIVVTTKDTTIQKGRETIKKEELKVGDQIVIIGSPNEEGQIVAKLIRIFNGEDVKALQQPSRSFQLPRFPFF